MSISNHPEWPRLTWSESGLAKLLSATSRQQGRLLGRMEALGVALRDNAQLHTLTEDVVKSSEIEGEKLEAEQVRSSIARHLGVDADGLVPSDPNVDGVVEMMLDATGGYDKPLTEQRLFSWHASLFSTGRNGMRRIIVGGWRDDREGPMQVISGAVGREQVHYEAPPAARVPHEMATFLHWFDRPDDTDPVLKAGLAHLWFVTIHPFDDGNGRIARAITDMMLSRSESSRRRFYSMSAQIRQDRDAYYAILERTQKGETDVTLWQTWFLNCLLRAIEGAEETPRLHPSQSTILGALCQRAVERTPDRRSQQAAGCHGREADDLEVGQAGEVLAGHGPPGHSGLGSTRRAEARSWRWAQHELLVYGGEVRPVMTCAF